jgi:hypothetical protein
VEVSATSSATALDLENAKISGASCRRAGNAVIETISGTSVQGGTIVRLAG